MSSEPLPRKVSLPAQADFPIRVGIVLTEDKKSKTILRIPAQKYSAEGDGRHIPLEAGHLYTLENKDGALRLSGQTVSNILVSRDCITISPAENIPLAPQEGLPIQGIRAGRGFHWEQELVEYFPGRVEFRAHASYLNVINELPFEDYLACVAVSEMSSDCPPEFLKAQAIVARSWAYCFLGVKYPGKNYDLCNDDMSQRYQGSTFLTDEALSAIRESAGQYIIGPDSHVCPAYYSKICGGKSETPEEAFGFQIPGLESILDSREELSGEQPSLSLKQPSLHDENNLRAFLTNESLELSSACGIQARSSSETAKYLGGVDVDSDYFRWKLSYTKTELLDVLRKRGLLGNAVDIHEITVLKRGSSGRATELCINYLDDSGKKHSQILNSQFDIRKALHPSFLFSSQFVISETDDGRFEILGGGWGHGVGLCQVGALQLALDGKISEAIVKHYFPSCSLERII